MYMKFFRFSTCALSWWQVSSILTSLAETLTLLNSGEQLATVHAGNQNLGEAAKKGRGGEYGLFTPQTHHVGQNLLKGPNFMRPTFLTLPSWFDKKSILFFGTLLLLKKFIDFLKVSAISPIDCWSSEFYIAKESEIRTCRPKNKAQAKTMFGQKNIHPKNNVQPKINVKNNVQPINHGLANWFWSYYYWLWWWRFSPFHDNEKARLALVDVLKHLPVQSNISPSHHDDVDNHHGYPSSSFWSS